MLFKTKFKFEVVEIHKSGLRVTNYLSGRKKDVMKEVELYKRTFKEYEMVGKNGMIVWV